MHGDEPSVDDGATLVTVDTADRPSTWSSVDGSHTHCVAWSAAKDASTTSQDGVWRADKAAD